MILLLNQNGDVRVGFYVCASVTAALGVLGGGGVRLGDNLRQNLGGA